MRESKSVKEEYEKLKIQELPDLKSQLENLDKDTLPKLKKEVKSMDESRSQLQTRKSLADQIQTDVIVINKLAHECVDIDRRMESYIKANPIVSSENGGDLSGLNEEKKQLDDELNRLTGCISERRDRIGACYKRADRVNTLKEKLNEMKTRRSELEMRSQKKTALGEKRDELAMEIMEAEAECGRLVETLKAATKTLNDLQKERDSMINEHREVVDKRRRFRDELWGLAEKIAGLTRSIDEFETNDLPRLDKLRKDLKAIDFDEKQVIISTHFFVIRVIYSKRSKL